MTSREKVYSIFTRHNTDAHCMWTGNPLAETVEKLTAAWGLEQTPEALYSFLNDDCRWIPADSAYKHPEGRPALDPAWHTERRSLSAPGCFADAETLADVEKYPWPDPDYLDFTDIYAQIDKFPDKMVMTGMWACFYHVVMDFFGMENYFIKMIEEPKIVDAVTEHVVDFYVEANDRFLQGLGDRADVIFFGNDFGTQRDLMIDPALWRRFVLPSTKRIIDGAKKYGKLVMHHSCGSVWRVIPDLIDAGVDVLHPLQAQAAGMSADELKRFKNDISFIGGIDAQSFFVNATPQQIRDEVHRVRDTLGPNIVISPSHEAILPNVPPANVLAMAEAAHD